MDNNNNVLVMGNGFDLYHGLKTSYVDFVKFARDVKKTQNGTEGRNLVINNSLVKCFIEVFKENQSWIDCENEIEAIVNIIDKIINKSNIINDDNILLKSNIRSFEFEKLRLMSNNIVKKSNVSSIEFNSSIFRKYQDINKNIVMDILKRDMEHLISLFRLYLENHVMHEMVNKTSSQIKELNASYVVNFNYTNTYERYEIQKENVCFIHGSVIDNNMVMGIRDFDEKNLDTIYFKKYFQRIHKHTDTINWKRFAGNTISHFFGHSLSNTDGDIIRQIYQNSIKIIIYYLPQKKDYENKIINLIDSLGKNEVIEGMYSGSIEFMKIK